VKCPPTSGVSCDISVSRSGFPIQSVGWVEEQSPTKSNSHAIYVVALAKRRSAQPTALMFPDSIQVGLIRHVFLRRHPPHGKADDATLIRPTRATVCNRGTIGGVGANMCLRIWG